jgi:hypothetical protein
LDTPSTRAIAAIGKQAWFRLDPQREIACADGRNRNLAAQRPIFAVLDLEQQRYRLGARVLDRDDDLARAPPIRRAASRLEQQCRLPLVAANTTRNRSSSRDAMTFVAPPSAGYQHDAALLHFDEKPVVRPHPDHPNIPVAASSRTHRNRPRS